MKNEDLESESQLEVERVEQLAQVEQMEQEELCVSKNQIFNNNNNITQELANDDYYYLIDDDRRVLVTANHMYYLHKPNKKSNYWRCIKYGKCTASITISSISNKIIE